jgi:RNA polymerase sigma factor (sigma-70 family)
MPIFENNRPLLDAFRRGDRSALTEVYQFYVERVAALVRFGFTIDGPPAVQVPGVFEPEIQCELVQEIFIRAFAEPARLAYDGLRSYRPYLMRIAKNLLIDRARQRIPASVSFDDADETIPEHAEFVSPEEALHWQALSAEAEAFVAGLDAEARDLVRLRFEEDCSQAEAAERMGVSRRRVRTLEARVQKGLLRHLKKKRPDLARSS